MGRREDQEGGTLSTGKGWERRLGNVLEQDSVDMKQEFGGGS